MVRRVLALLSLLAVLGGLLVPPLSYAADTYVRGYFRSNGTYVQPHYRSAPDGNPYNNYSTYPNVNPYTGQQGTRYRSSDPYTSPSLGGSFGSSQRQNCYRYGSQVYCY
jgi:hypothetical protein